MTQTGARNKKGPRERLVDSAIELFYRNGYSAVSVNEIIAHANSHKASFYRYFQSKEDLAVEYLNEQGRLFRETLEHLMERSENPGEFIKRWCSLLFRQSRGPEYAGCPLARLHGTLGDQEGNLQKESAVVLKMWIQTLAEYFEHEQKSGRISKEIRPQAAAEKMMRLYQGAAQMFRITRDAAEFKRFEADLFAELKLVE